MGILSRILGTDKPQQRRRPLRASPALRAFRRPKEKEALPSPSTERVLRVLQNPGGSAIAGTPLGESQSPADQVEHNKHWVFAAVRAISDAVGGATMRFYVEVGGEKAELGDVRPDHPLIAIWRRPNPRMSLFAMKKLVASSLELTGDAYVWKDKAGTLITQTLWFLRPQSVEMSTSKAGKVVYKVSEGGRTAALPAEDVMHFVLPDLREQFHGVSPLQAATQAVNTHEAIHESQDKAFQQGINPSAIVSVEDEPDEEEMTRLRAALNKLYQGSSKHGKVLIKSKSMEIAPWSRAPKEMDYIQSLLTNRDEILGIFGVPAAVIGLTADVNRASAHAMERVFAQRTVWPVLKLIADTVTLSLTSEFDDLIVAEFDDPTPNDQELWLRTLAQGLSMGAITADEWRNEFGYIPAEDGAGGTRLVKENLIPAEVAAGSTGDEGEGEKGGHLLHPETAQALRDHGIPVPTVAVLTKQEPTGLATPDEIVEQIAWTEEVSGFAEAARPGIQETFRFGWENELALQPGELGPEVFDMNVSAYMRGKDLEYFDELLVGTRHDLAQAISDGLAAGDTFAAMEARIGKVYDFQQTGRARRIARTESVEAQNMAGQAAREAVGVEEKEWVAIFVNTRESHSKADGQVVRNGQKFSVGSSRMVAPGDPSAPAEERVNCQCSAIASLSRKYAGTWGLVREAFAVSSKRIQDKGEARIATDVSEYFRRQREKVLAALGRLEGS